MSVLYKVCLATRVFVGFSLLAAILLLIGSGLVTVIALWTGRMLH